jgi:iron complex transport system substrate-binding protein
MFRIFLVFLALLHLLPDQSHAVTLTDQIGRTVSVPDDPKRIISFMPSLTEMVFDLGQGVRLVATVQHSNSPPAARELPRVGSYINLDIERIAALRPDLCLASQDGNQKSVIDRLESLGIAVYAFDPRSLEGIMDAVTRLGTIFHAESRAADQVEMMCKRLQQIDAREGRFRTRPRVFFQIDAGQIVSAGSNTFIDQLITRAGGINLAAGKKLYPRYSWEEILAMQPEVVIITTMAGGYNEEQLKADWRRWPQIPAVRDGRIHVVNADRFDRPTIRSFDCLEMLENIFHPQQNLPAY